MRKDVSFLLLVDPQVDHKILVHAVPAFLKIQFMNGARSREREKEIYYPFHIIKFSFPTGVFPKPLTELRLGARSETEIGVFRVRELAKLIVKCAE